MSEDLFVVSERRFLSLLLFSLKCEVTDSCSLSAAVDFSSLELR